MNLQAYECQIRHHLIILRHADEVSMNVGRRLVAITASVGPLSINGSAVLKQKEQIASGSVMRNSYRDIRFRLM